MVTRVAIKPELLHWASERAGHDLAAFAERFPKLEAWAEGTEQPTLKQLDAFARATHTPLGFFFLPEPPNEPLPLPDFRRVAKAETRRASPELLDIIYLCQQRQDWYRQHLLEEGAEQLAFIGSATTSASIVETARTMRQTLNFEADTQRRLASWKEAVKLLTDLAEEAGILVMRSGIVGNNTQRVLRAEEFRGFAISDPLAPLVFINTTDTQAAQLFTLAHELAHLWLGQSGVTNPSAGKLPDDGIERWCNGVAAEFLVPMEAFQREFRPENELSDEMKRLARAFRVSTLVILRRIHDAGALTKAEFWRRYREERERLFAIPRPETSGGNFFKTLPARTSRRFTEALISSTLEGRTLYRDAFRLLGLKKQETFDKLGTELGVS